MIYIKLFLTFLKIGFVGFGGGMAILPLICAQAVHETWEFHRPGDCTYKDHQK